MSLKNQVYSSVQSHIRARAAAMLLLPVVTVSLCLPLYACSNSTANSQPDELSLPVNDIPQKKTETPKETSQVASPHVNTALQAKFEQIAQTYGGQISIMAEAADGSWEASYNADKPQVAASMIKLLVMSALLQAVQDGKVSLDQSYTLKGSDIVGGTGSLQSSGAGTTQTYRQLLNKMINVSDNTATNIIIDTLGADAINTYAHKQGLKNTTLNRRMMNLGTGVENYISARDASTILVRAQKGELVSPELSQVALEALKSQTDSFGLLQGMTSSVTFAHKTGTLAGVKNDGGIVLSHAPYTMVVLTQGLSESAAQACMTSVAQAVAEVQG